MQYDGLREFTLANYATTVAVSHKQPLRLSMALEVTFDLRNEFRDLDYLCSGAYILALSLKSLLFPGRKEGRRRRKQR